MNNSISSKQNQYVKLVKSLSLKKNRDKHRLFLVEGIRSLEEAVSSNTGIEFCLFSEKLISHDRGKKLLDKINHLGIKTWQVEENVLEETADTENPQGITAVVKMKVFQMDDLNMSRNSQILIADGIQDPGNFGTMIRTACAAGAAGIVSVRGTVDMYNSKVVRSSMGALFHLPVISSTTSQDVWAFLKDKGYRVMVADLSGKRFYYEADLRGHVAWVLGNEANGPDSFWVEHSDDVVKIPLIGLAESLNVAVAAGILLYDTVRQNEVKTINQ